MNQSLTRRAFAASVPLALAARRAAAADTASLRIGYQKNGPLLVMKQQGTLERRFAAQGIGISWHEFQSGPPLLEALDADGIDLGATGDTPPLYAQAAGADLVYVAHQPAPGKSAAILVHAESAIHGLADLAGRRVGFTKGSSAHNVVVRVLRKAGLGYGDIIPVYLQPADAAAAFPQGAIDAWSIWDPFYAIAERDPATRVLTTGEGIAPSNSFFLARREFAAGHGALVTAVVEEAQRVAAWIATHPDELARLLSEATRVPLEIERIAAARGNYQTAFITDAVVAQQQAIADTFHQLGLLPRPIRIADAVWHPGT